LVPSLWVNLFSIPKATSKPNFKVICEDNLITVNSNEQKLHFTKILPHGKGKILATDFFTNSECASLVLKKTTYADLHNKLGHPHKQAVIDTAKHYGIDLQKQTEEPVCIESALSKIRVKNLGSNEDNNSKSKGERLAIDISSINKISYGGSKFWLLTQYEYTSYIWSYFLAANSELSGTVTNFLKKFQKEHNLKVKFMRLDNSGENKILQQDVDKDPELKLQFEFTSLYTPRQNGKIERKFATLWGKVRAQFNSAKLPWGLQNKLWAQCANLSTQLENISYEKMHNKQPNMIDNLHTFGE
jgi:hypothetical protein